MKTRHTVYIFNSKVFLNNECANRIIGLDILRSIAILNVVAIHLVIVISALLKINLLWLPIPDGVDLFFVLSGFLIGNIFIKSLKENNNKNLSSVIKDFWIMRWFRTLPNYYWITFLVFCLNKFQMPIKNLIFLQNFYKPCGNPFPETWSLAVEEWFYLLLPIFTMLFLKLTKSNLKAVIITVLLFIFISFFSRIFFYNQSELHDFSIYLVNVRNIVLSRLDSIAFGLFGAVLYHYYPKFFFSNKNIKLIIGLLIIATYTIYTNVFCMYKVIEINWFNWNFSLLISAFGILLLFPYLIKLKVRNKFVIAFVTFTSNISYSMYLIHKTILLNLFLLIYLKLKIIPLAVLVVIYLLALYFLSYLNYSLIEKYFIKLRYKFINTSSIH